MLDFRLRSAARASSSEKREDELCRLLRDVRLCSVQGASAPSPLSLRLPELHCLLGGELPPA